MAIGGVGRRKLAISGSWVNVSAGCVPAQLVTVAAGEGFSVRLVVGASPRKVPDVMVITVTEMFSAYHISGHSIAYMIIYVFS